MKTFWPGVVTRIRAESMIACICRGVHVTRLHVDVFLICVSLSAFKVLEIVITTAIVIFLHVIIFEPKLKKLITKKYRKLLSQSSYMVAYQFTLEKLKMIFADQNEKFDFCNSQKHISGLKSSRLHQILFTLTTNLNQ